MFDDQHPFHRFRFCPVCGSDRLSEHGPAAFRCGACGLSYYTNPRGATVAFIINDRGELLCGRRAKNPAQGTRDVPGGFLDLDETAEEGMCREIFEEAGLQVEPAQLRYLFSQPNRYPFSGIMCRTIDLFYEVRLDGHPSFQGRDDIASLEWIPLSDVHPEEFGMASIARGLQRYLEAVL